MKPPRPFETSGNTQRPRCHTPEDLNLEQHRCVNLRADTSPTCLLIGVTFTSKSPNYTVSSPRQHTHCHLNHNTAWSVCCLCWLISGRSRQITAFCVHSHFLSTMSYLWSGWRLSIWQLLSIVATSPTPTVSHRTATIIVLDRPLLKWIQRSEIYKQL